MKYELDKDRIKKAKKIVKDLKQKLSAWEIELEDAKEAQKKNPNKYFRSIQKRIDYAEHQISYCTRTIQEFEEAIKNKSITI